MPALGDSSHGGDYDYQRYLYNEHAQQYKTYLVENGIKIGQVGTDASKIVQDVDKLAVHACKQKYRYSALCRTLESFGITMHSIDHAEEVLGQQTKETLQTLNDKFVAKIGELPKGEKYVTWTGAMHSITNEGAKGISETLSIPAIRIVSSSDETIRVEHPGRSVNGGHQPQAFDHAITYPNRSVDVPERILPEATIEDIPEKYCKLAKKPWNLPLIGSAALAVGLAGFTAYQYYNRKETSKTDKATATDTPPDSYIAASTSRATQPAPKQISINV